MNRPTTHSFRRPGRALRYAVGVGLLVALAAGSAISAPSAATAHAVLLRTSPARGATLPTGPAEVTLTFDEPPLQLGAAVRVSGPGGLVSSGSPRIEKSIVHQALAPNLPAGAYRVDWKVTSDDGHPVSDTFSFTVTGGGAISAAPSPANPSTSANPAPNSATTSASSPPSPPSSSSILPWGLAALAVVALALVGFAASRGRGGVKP
jgi:copper resistance protein C